MNAFYENLNLKVEDSHPQTLEEMWKVLWSHFLQVILKILFLVHELTLWTLFPTVGWIPCSALLHGEGLMQA